MVKYIGPDEARKIKKELAITKKALEEIIKKIDKGLWDDRYFAAATSAKNIAKQALSKLAKED